MRNRYVRLMALTCVVALALAALPALASADTYRFSGKNASAWWDSGDGLTARSVYLWAGMTTGADHAVGTKPNRGASDGFMLSVWDAPAALPVPGVTMRSLDLFVTPYDAGVTRTLNSAHVAGTYTATVSEWTGEPPADPETPWEPTNVYSAVVTLDVTWTGTGALVREMSSYKSFSDGFRWIEHTNRTYRPALVTGTIAAPAIGLDLDASLMSGELSNDRSGSVVFGPAF